MNKFYFIKYCTNFHVYRNIAMIFLKIKHKDWIEALGDSMNYITNFNGLKMYIKF